jgi:clorobiocin biosynthesis protein CloN6
VWVLLGETERALLPTGTLPDIVDACKRKILAYSSDQIMPVRRPFGGRWFDEATVLRQMIEDSRAQPAGRGTGWSSR